MTPTNSMTTYTVLADPLLRSNEMSLMNEALARAHCLEQREYAERQRLALRVLAARRMEKRAARAAARARRLAAAAVASTNRAF